VVDRNPAQMGTFDWNSTVYYLKI